MQRQAERDVRTAERRQWFALCAPIFLFSVACWLFPAKVASWVLIGVALDPRRSLPLVGLARLERSPDIVLPLLLLAFLLAFAIGIVTYPIWLGAFFLIGWRLDQRGERWTGVGAACTPLVIDACLLSLTWFLLNPPLYS